MRVEPFTSYHKALQSGRFDHADRLFHSLDRTYHSCTHSSSDVKELIPELFYLPDLLLNRNRCDLGTRQDGQAVDDVVLPRWASDAADFVAKHRAALESDYVSAHLHLWIDLIFGCKQRGKPAVEALNKFFYLTYEVDFRGRTPSEVRAIKAQINNFGQTPQQLWVSAAHPQRRPRPVPPSLSLREHGGSASGGGSGGGGVVVGATIALRLDAVPLALLALDDVLLLFDAGRKTHARRRANPTTDAKLIGGGDVHRLAAFAPNLPLAKAALLTGADARGRDALLVSGGHWDHSLCISLAHGAGGTRHRLVYHSDVVTCVAVSSCCRWLMSGALDATANLWSLGEGGIYHPGALQGAAQEPTHVLRGHSAAVTCVAISSTLRLAASGSRDGTTALYTLREGKRVRAAGAGRRRDRAARALRGRVRPHRLRRGLACNSSPSTASSHGRGRAPGRASPRCASRRAAARSSAASTTARSAPGGCTTGGRSATTSVRPRQSSASRPPMASSTWARAAPTSFATQPCGASSNQSRHSTRASRTPRTRPWAR